MLEERNLVTHEDYNQFELKETKQLKTLCEYELRMIKKKKGSEQCELNLLKRERL